MSAVHHFYSLSALVRDKDVFSALCCDDFLSGHASGVPSPGEGTSPCSPPSFTGSSVQEEEEPGLSGHGRSWPACKPSAAQGLSALHTFPRQHELSQQCWKSVTQAFTQERPGNLYFTSRSCSQPRLRSGQEVLLFKNNCVLHFLQKLKIEYENLLLRFST